MPSSKSNLGSLDEDVINDISDLSEMKISDEKGSTEKSTMTLIEKNVYHDLIYVNAAKIFQGIHKKKPQDRILVRYGDDSASPMLTFKDEYSQRVSYELAFSALKYQDLLEKILLDSCAYPCQSIESVLNSPAVIFLLQPDELTSLLVVMLYDLQDRKFQAREIVDEEEPVAEVRKIEHYLYSFKTKLAAALARCRIKHDALSIEYILPETIRKQEQRASALPLYAWINTFKISLQDVFSNLKMKGFTRVESVSDFDHYTYCVDQHCHDVLVFPASLKEELLNLDLFADYKLLLQDKSRSLAVHSVRALLNTDDDIVVAHMGSRLTIAHMSVLTNHSMSRIFVCGVKSPAKEAELRNLFRHVGCKNIQLLHEDFTEIGPTDQRLQKAKVILLLPQCSGVGAGNPIEFILNEHGDAGLLRDLFQGSVSEDKLSILAERQLKELMHAMKFNKVQAIVYCTSSVYPEENEVVVNKALESRVEGNKVQRYRLVPPVFPICSNSKASAEFFFKMEPSEISNCCFLAILEREKASSENLSVKDMLARAAAKGLLDGIVVEKSKKEEKKKKKLKMTQHASNIVGNGVETKAEEFLHHEAVSNIHAEDSVSKAVSNKEQKTVNKTDSYVQLKKATNPVSDSALPKVLKRTSNLSSIRKASERQPLTRKAHAEDRMVVLKPVEIVLPPVIVPYLSPQGNRPRMPTHHCWHDWIGAKSLSGRIFPPPLSKAVKPTVVKQPRPWL
ncbi:putative methyltransferase NSUN7 isoform X1 [Dromaius novaehollandiae]|uniref:putative methyltransferase NSUN7 isoform X1 n=1 Tax=Dromaius novaehollandiae TaxID=8790 RepID=UPI000E1EA98B|nr:putative methyltransferase NSUN7 isoform X1 [Dromaius novaehollandiae]XP_025949492.1 putative methyltransferase NSUN7 isoform X1 [Dromaius novaehollandiae]XP_025949493.1 putative methyltransferase NSUN7 isoform X1 [Dromaius novaehollandiae]